MSKFFVTRYITWQAYANLFSIRELQKLRLLQSFRPKAHLTSSKTAKIALLKISFSRCPFYLFIFYSNTSSLRGVRKSGARIKNLVSWNNDVSYLFSDRSAVISRKIKRRILVTFCVMPPVFRILAVLSEKRFQLLCPRNINDRGSGIFFHFNYVRIFFEAFYQRIMPGRCWKLNYARGHKFSDHSSFVGRSMN